MRRNRLRSPPVAATCPRRPEVFVTISSRLLSQVRIWRQTNPSLLIQPLQVREREKPRQYRAFCSFSRRAPYGVVEGFWPDSGDRKSTRLNSSHGYISYAVFCLKK